MTATVLLVVAALINMHGWFIEEIIPPGDFAGYTAVVDYVHDALLRYGRVPAWCTKWFAGSTYFVNSFKEYLTLPLASWLGSLLAVKVMFLILKTAAAIGVYSIFVRFFRSPAAGLIAGYAYGFGACSNHETEHLDVVFSYALFPLVVVAAVEALRRPRWDWAIALGVLGACQFYVNYVQALVCVVTVAMLLAFRPWPESPGDPNPAAGPRLAVGRALGAGAAAAVAVALAGSQLAWFVYDAEHHALFTPRQVENQLGVFSQHSPFLLLNRMNWLGPWLAQHLPPYTYYVNLRDPLFAQRHYLGIVVLVVCAAGWFAARRSHSLRRWYQAMALLFLFQYWMSLGPRTVLWQVARSFHWSESVDAELRTWLTVASGACLAVAGLLAAQGCRRRSDRLSTGRTEGFITLAVLLFFPAHPLFNMARATLPWLQHLRAPGHFFDVAPFSLCCVFGIALVAILRNLPRPRLRNVAAAVAEWAVVPGGRTVFEGQWEQEKALGRYGAVPAGHLSLKRRPKTLNGPLLKTGT